MKTFKQVLQKSFLLIVGLSFLITVYGQSLPDKPVHRRGLMLKAGINFSSVKGTGTLKTSSRNGFMAGIGFAPASPSLFGYRTELIFSRQGYHFTQGGASGKVEQDYLLLPQLMTLTFAKKVQIQAGGQLGILLKAKDSTISPSSQPSPYARATEYFKRFSYGLAGGLEIYPVKWLLVGGRINFDLGSMAENNNSSVIPPYIPADQSKLKNYVVQLYVGVTL